MDIHHIEYFLQLVKYEHVSLTADFLNISQPSLSKSISTLEAELGIKLFDRIGRRIKLNHNGEEFAKYAEQAIQLLNNGIYSAKGMRYETSGKIEIICYAYEPIIVPCITAYSQLNPFTTFSISQSHEQNDMKTASELDFILCSSTDESFSMPKEQFWVSQPLFTEKYCLLLSPRFREYPKEQRSIDLAELKDATFVTMQQDNLFFNDITYKLCQNAGFFPKVYCQTDDFLVKVKIVAQGLAIAFIPESCLQDAYTYSPDLCCFELENCVTDRTICLLRRKKALMTDASLDFWDFVMDYYNLPEDERN